MIDQRMFYIGGAWVAPREARDFALIDPSTEERCGVVALGSAADADAAVEAAPLPAWAATPPAERRAVLARILEISSRVRSAQAVSLEMGAPIDWARRAVPAGANNIRPLLAALTDFAFDHPFGPEPRRGSCWSRSASAP